MTWSDVQSWVLIGVFATLMTGVLAVFSVSLTRVLRAEIGRLDTKLDAKFEAMGYRFDALETKAEGIDRDVTALTKRFCGGT